MSIDPNKQYRTRDGRAVRIYAVDHGPRGDRIHGAILDEVHGWINADWHPTGQRFGGGIRDDYHRKTDLIEVTLADELRDQIPWSALRPEIRWVAMDRDKGWSGFDGSSRPTPTEPGGHLWAGNGHHHIGAAVAMPEVDPARWRETLIERPEDT